MPIPILFFHLTIGQLFFIRISLNECNIQYPFTANFAHVPLINSHGVMRII